MISRLERLHEDKLAGLNAEVEEIIQAIDRAEFDQKDACEVVFALRLDILKNVVCDSATPANTVYDNTDTREFREYEGMYDDFHYDIGHGKGTGEGGNKSIFGVGDYEVDVGAHTRTTEGSLYRQPSSSKSRRY